MSAPPSPTGIGSALPIETPSTAFGAATVAQDPMRNVGYTVAAYSVLWVIMLAFVFASWRRQRTLDARIDELERAVAKGPPPRGGTAAR